MTKTRGQEQFGPMKLFNNVWLFGQLLNKPIVISTKIESSLFQARVSLRIDLGPKYLFLSPLVPSKQEKNIQTETTQLLHFVYFLSTEPSMFAKGL